MDRYDITESSGQLLQRLTLPMAQLKFERTVQLHGQYVRIREVVENLSAMDPPPAWTQHVTLSPPFLDPARTQFRTSMTPSVVSQADPGFNAYLTPGKEFSGPIAPRRDGGESDLCQMHKTGPASGCTAHLADPQRDHAYFVVFTPQFRQAFGYFWKRADFPWLGIWKENCSRPASPWDGKTVPRGMEFGVSPIPETRPEMADRNRLLDAAVYKGIASRG